MASSSTVAAAERHHDEAELSTLPSPPPPTPSGQSPAPSNADDTLSRLLHRLLITPTLCSASFSRRLHTPPAPPLISLLHCQQDLLLSAAANHGFFHLTDHDIPSHLPAAALTEAQSLLSTTPPNSRRNRSCLGFSADEAEEADDTYQVFDVGTADLDGMPALGEYSRCLEKVGLEVVDMLVGSRGLAENPFLEGRLRPRSLMWVSSSPSLPMNLVKSYPYVVCMQSQVKEPIRPCRVLDGDTGAWIPVQPAPDSILVMLGDIAQVWSNGRLKKMRGMPQETSHENFDDDNHISLSLLVTLSMDAIVSPLSSVLLENHNECGNKEIDDNNKMHHTFSFDKYAWKLYHGEFPLDDSLIIYRN